MNTTTFALCFSTLSLLAACTADAGNEDTDSVSSVLPVRCTPDMDCTPAPTPTRPVVTKPLPPPPFLVQSSVWPSNDAHYWTEELQGITHDANNWYVASREHVMRFALTDDLHGYPNLFVDNPWASQWSHVGSPAYANGTVVIPLERNGTGVGRFVGTTWIPDSPTMATRAAFGVLGTDLSALGVAYLATPPANIPDEQGGGDACPWVAYNARDGLFYSSGFDPSFIYAYSIQLNPVRVSFHHATRIINADGTPYQVTRVQSGVISDTNKLYLLSDATAGAIYNVDLASGIIGWSGWVDHNPSFPEYEELEGITIFDSTGKNAPGIDGQLHVLLLDNDALGQDDWYFKHYRVNGTL